MTPAEMMEGMKQKNIALTQKNDEYIELSEKRAKFERVYNIALSKELIKQKLDGQSVTLIEKIAKGVTMVADLKYALDVSEGVLKACLGSIKALVTAIDTYRSLLAWERAEYDRTQGGT